ncbi:MAG: FIST C-terminal domain-containing protein [Actinobacteria bacterium]|nr:FIST C-terminal domain-containing protein [Actinomycetota bacterium]
MPFAAALSEHPVAAEAVGEVIGEVLEAVGPRPDLAALFVGAAHTGAIDEIAGAVQAVLAPVALLGTTAGMVLGRDREVEDRPAVALWAARFPPGTPAAVPVVLEAEVVDGGVAVHGLDELPSGRHTLVLVADPFTFPVDGLVAELRSARPDVTIIGGLASAARTPGGNRLVADGAVVDRGAVGVVLPPAAGVRAVVSQGCRPAGDPMIVTRATGNVVEELAGRASLDRLQQLVDASGPDERELLAAGLQLGVVIDESKESFGRGDFVIRAVLGGDRSTGALVVGDAVPVGTTVQFHVRDADSADEDLRLALADADAAQAALVFTCNGRGMNLFGAPDHDARLVAGRAPACAGMSCAGEIGPVGGRTFLHGFTASIALFGEPGDRNRPLR